MTYLKKRLVLIFALFLMVFCFSTQAFAKTIGLDKIESQEFKKLNQTETLEFTTPYDGSIVVSGIDAKLLPPAEGEMQMVYYHMVLKSNSGQTMDSYDIWTQYIIQPNADINDPGNFGHVCGDLVSEGGKMYDVYEDGKLTLDVRTGNISIPAGSYKLEITPYKYEVYKHGFGWDSPIENASFPNMRVDFNVHFYNGNDQYVDENRNNDNMNVYRLYNPATAEHLYTTDAVEMDHLSKNGWNYEGVNWQSPKSGEPVYRLYSPITHAHLYTKDQNEINTITQQGWQMDNNGQPMFYSGGSGNVYRLYNPTIAMHLLTTNVDEYNQLAGQGWNQENVAFNCL